jgi:hypothetical protein
MVIREEVRPGSTLLGEPTASGVYFYRFRVEDYDAARKMILMK